MAKRSTGILLEFGKGPDEDDWNAEEGDGLEAIEEPQRPARDAQALIGAIDRDLQELRALLAETG